MSWYVGMDGRKVWIDKEELVYTVNEPEPEAELPLEILTYLATTVQKAVYQEHSIDDEESKKSKKKGAPAARTRGFLVRVDQDDRVRVMAPLQGAVDDLIKAGVVTRLDVDDPTKGQRRSKAKDSKEEEAVVGPPLGINECRVETRNRIQHQAHGFGFCVQASSSEASQRINIFTGPKEMSWADWHTQIVEALSKGGNRVTIGRLADADGPARPDGKPASRGAFGAPKKKDEARQQEDDWLESVLGRCMVGKEKDKEKAKDTASPAAAGGEEAPASSQKAPVQVPPWLRR